MIGCDGLPGAVEAVEGTCGIKEVLRAVGGKRGAEAVEHVDRRAVGLLSVSPSAAGTALTRTALATRPSVQPAATGRVTGVNGVTKIKMLGDRRCIGRLLSHVMAFADLT
jgi:hypothetical protein